MVKRKRTKAARLKIMSRDGGLCGIHLAECGQPIIGRCEVDHIIPLGLAELIAPAPREFDGHWNYQPMHEQCNRNKADTMKGRLLEELEIAVTVGRTHRTTGPDSNVNATISRFSEKTFSYARKSLSASANTNCTQE